MKDFMRTYGINKAMNDPDALTRHFTAYPDFTTLCANPTLPTLRIDKNVCRTVAEKLAMIRLRNLYQIKTGRVAAR